MIKIIVLSVVLSHVYTEDQVVTNSSGNGTDYEKMAEGMAILMWSSIKEFLINLFFALLFGLAAAFIGFLWYRIFLCFCGFTREGIREDSMAAYFQSSGARRGWPLALIVAILCLIGGTLYYMIAQYNYSAEDWSFGAHWSHMWTVIGQMAKALSFGLGFGLLVTIGGVCCLYVFLCICGCGRDGIREDSLMAGLQSSGARGGLTGASIFGVIFFFVGMICYYVFLYSDPSGGAVDGNSTVIVNSTAIVNSTMS